MEEKWGCSVGHADRAFGVNPSLSFDGGQYHALGTSFIEGSQIYCFWLGGEKALGPDGFQAFFFQFFWDELGEDLLAVVEESRSRGFILNEFNCALVALIPKKAKPEGMEEFCPILL